MQISSAVPATLLAILVSSAILASPTMATAAVPGVSKEGVPLGLTAVNLREATALPGESGQAPASASTGQSAMATAGLAPNSSPKAPEPQSSELSQPESSTPESSTPESSESGPSAETHGSHDHGSHDHGDSANPDAGEKEHEPEPNSAAPTPGHVDPAPAGIDPTDAVSDTALIQRSGVDEPTPGTAGDERPGESAADGLGPIPAGNPGISSLSAHVRPSCLGTGTDGNRVQAAYVYEQGQANRLDVVNASTGETLRTALLSYLADVDDTFVLSSMQAPRRVRWVFDPNTCRPIIAELEVPAGSLAGPDSGLGAIRSAAEAAGLAPSNGTGTELGRKILSFADAEDLCGIGQIYRDDRAVDNVNDGRYTMVARVDRGCWATFPGWHSTAAHELIHMLGGVQRTSPNSTSYGHCTDERDAMCYADGGTTPAGTVATMRTSCAGAFDEALLDCNRDDYFNAGTPAAGSYLATNWNTAKSSYLDVSAEAATPNPVTPNPIKPTSVEIIPQNPKVAIMASTALRPGLASYARVSSSESGAIRWSASTDACLGSYRTGSSVVLHCPSYAPAAVTLTAIVTTRDGRQGRATKVVALTGSAANLGVSLSAPSRVFVRSSAALTATVKYGRTPVRASVRLQQFVPSGGFGYWKTLVSTTLPSTGTARLIAPSSTSSGARTFRLVVAVGAGSGWRATVSSYRTIWSVYASVLYAKVSQGRPNTLWVRAATRTGSALAGRRVVLQSRTYGSSTWRYLTSRTTNSYGWAAVKTAPGRGTSYRWAYYGETRVIGSYSGQVWVRY